MNRIIVAMGVMSLLLMASNLAATERPQLPECGELLPQGVHYSVTLKGQWDTRTEKTSGTLAVTLTDEISGDTPKVIPEEAKPFVACIQSAMGIDV